MNDDDDDDDDDMSFTAIQLVFQVDVATLEIERMKYELEQKETNICDMLDALSEMETKYQVSYIRNVNILNG